MLTLGWISPMLSSYGCLQKACSHCSFAGWSPKYYGLALFMQTAIVCSGAVLLSCPLLSCIAFSGRAWHVHTGHYMGTTHWTPPQWQTVNTNYNYIVKVKIYIYIGYCYIETLINDTYGSWAASNGVFCCHYRSASWTWQPSKLFGSDRGWYGSSYRILG